MTDYNYLTVCQVSGITIGVVESNSHRWNKIATTTVQQQCNPSNCVNEHIPISSDESLNICVINYDDFFNTLDFNTNLTNYAFANNRFFDFRKKFAIGIGYSGNIEYWYDGSLSLSISFLIHLFLINNNQSFLHCAAVSYGGSAHLFPAYGGVGKTLLISHLLQNTCVKFLGDDLAILKSDGTARAYPRPMCLYSYHKHCFSKQFKEYNIKHIGPKYLLKAIRRARIELGHPANLEFLPFMHNWGINGDYVLMDPKIMFGSYNIEERMLPIKTVTKVIRSPSIKSFAIKKDVPRKEIVRFMSAVTLQEWSIYSKSLLYMKGLAPSEWPDYFQSTVKNIQNALKNVSSFNAIELPWRYNQNDYFVEAMRILEGS